MNMFDINYKYILIIVLTILLLSGSFITPVTAQSIGPSHDLSRTDDTDDTLEIDIEVAEDENNDPLTKDAAITYNVTITTQNARNTYPYIYPIDMDISENGDIIKSQTVFLNPTLNENYTPSYGNTGERQDYELKEQFQVYLTFNDQFDSDVAPNGYLERDIEFTFESRYTEYTYKNNVFNDINTYTAEDTVVEGTTPAGRSSSSASISSTSGYDEISEVNHVDRYRLHESESEFGFLEDSAIPYQEDNAGSLTNFQSMREPNSDGSTVMHSDNNGLKLVTQTENIPRVNPQTVVITYNLFGGDELTVDPVRADMESIDPDTEYVLPNNPEYSEHCQVVSASNGVCLFTLNSEEVEEINKLGELYLEYDSNGQDVSVEIFCQGIISGYFSEDSSTCGNNGLVSSDLIEISEFQGKQVTADDSYDYHSKYVPLYFNRASGDGYTAEVNMSSSIRTSLDDDESVPVEAAIVTKEQLDSDSISSYVALDEDIELERGDNFVFDINRLINGNDIVDTYFVIVCDVIRTPDCNSTDNIDMEELNFGLPGDNSPELNLKSPILIELEKMSTETVIEERVQTQTTDSTFAEDTEWRRLDGETIQDFTGYIDESVTVNGVQSSDPFDYQNEAENKLSDIRPEGEWVRGDYESYVSVDESFRAYVPDSTTMTWGGFERVSSTPERTAQIGMDEQSFNVVSGSELQSITDSEKGWYLDRDNTATQSSNDRVETLYRHTDPDDCLNCLTAEKHDPDSSETTEAEARFENTPNQDIIRSPDGENNWERVSNEAAIATLRENNVEYKYRDSDLEEGYTKIFENESTGDAVWRNGEFDERGIHKWERTTEINQLPFKAPRTDEVTEWQFETYDIEYVYPGIIANPADLYTYQKDIEKELVTWGLEPVWFDFSNSEPNQESWRALSQVRVSYVGTSEVHYIDWVDNIHTQTPEEIGNNISEICDSGTYTINDEVAGGTGGVGMIETCNVNGEETILRIGKQYNQEGIFNPEITLLDESMSTDTGQIRVNSNEGAGVPEFEVSAANRRVDYNVGKIAINGKITAPHVGLDHAYQLEISPSDSFSGTEGCPIFYRSEMTNDIQMETSTTDTFRQTNTCVYNAFEDTDEIPEEFTKYSESGNERIVNNIPARAIQNCYSSAVASSATLDDGECMVKDSYVGDTTTDTTIQYKSTFNGVSNYEEISGYKFTYDYCPSGYGIEEVDNGQDSVNEYSCNLNTNTEFDSKSRQISVDYNSIQKGIVETCNGIVTSSETNSHSGYTNVDENGNIVCQIVDTNNPGPTEFTLYDSESDEYYAPPKGAIRGKRYDSTRDSLGNCISFETSDGNLNCEYENSNGVTNTIVYASLTEGTWNIVPQSIDELDVNIDNTNEIIWESDFVLPSNADFSDGNIETSNNLDNPEEEFTTVINPRRIPISESQIGDGNIEFEFTLKSKNSDSIIQTETVDIQLCQANGPKNEFPRDSLGSNECDKFDTLLSGQPDFDTERTTIDDARKAFNEDGKTTHSITSVKNDICPYNLNYPSGEEDIEAHTINVDSNTNWNNLKQELSDKIRYRYAIGEPCNNNQEYDITPTQNSKSYTFTADSFRQPESQRNVRRIGVTELQSIHREGISQSLWSSNKLGHSLRLGTPIISNPDGGLNEHLISAYTFDHTGSQTQYLIDMFDSVINQSIPNKVTDVYSSKLYDYDEYLDNYDEDADGEDYWSHADSKAYDTNDLHHAKLAFGSACTSEGTSKIVHEHSDLSGKLCDTNIMDRDEAIEAFKDDEFRTPYAFTDNIGHQSAILSKPPLKNVDGNMENVDKYHYGNGLFGGNALYLNETSWLMINRPCIDKSAVGNSIDPEEGERSGADDTECTFEGGYSVLHGNGEVRPAERLGTKLSDSNYTVSFWVREEYEDSSVSAIDPVRTLFAISQPSTRQSRLDSGFGKRSSQVTEAPYAHTSAELSIMDIPINQENQLIYPDSIYGEERDRALSTVFPTNEFVNGIGTSINPTDIIIRDFVGKFGTPGIYDSGDTGEDDYYTTQATDYELGEWKHVTITSEKNDTAVRSPRTFDVYIDGQIQSTTTSPIQRFANDDGLEQRDPFLVETGGIYSDSVISIGARYLDAGYGQNGEYAPQIEASAGNIYIDDLRIYNESVNELSTIGDDSETYSDIKLPKNSDIGQIYNDFYAKYGRIISHQLSEDSNKKNIESINPLSTINLYVDYSGKGSFGVTMIPCENGSCYDDAAAVVQSSELNSLDMTKTQFNTGNSEFEFKEIDGIKLYVNLQSSNIQETPVINSFDITIDDTPYGSCQEILMNSPSFAGNDIIAQLAEIDESGTQDKLVNYEAECDMSTDDGGWTKFYWAEENTEYNSNTDKQNRLMSDCNSGSCFTAENFEVPNTIDLNDFQDHMNINSESDLRPQILIKSIEDGNTQEWAAFEFTDFKTNGDNDYTKFLESYFNGSLEGDAIVSSLSTINNNDLLNLDYGTNDCLYAFSTSQGYNSDNCITDVSSSNDNTLLMNLGASSSFTHMYIERNSEEGVVTDITCLGNEEAERCEVYYRVGSSGDYPDDLGIAIFDGF